MSEHGLNSSAGTPQPHSRCGICTQNRGPAKRNAPTGFLPVHIPHRYRSPSYRAIGAYSGEKQRPAVGSVVRHWTCATFFLLFSIHGTSKVAGLTLSADSKNGVLHAFANCHTGNLWRAMERKDVLRGMVETRSGIWSTTSLLDPKREQEDSREPPAVKRNTAKDRIARSPKRARGTERSNVDGAFQTSLSPLLRDIGPLSNPPPPPPPLPYAEEIKALLRTLEIPIALTVILGCLVLAGQTLHDDRTLEVLLNQAEDAISSVFILEYIIRWYSRNLEPMYLLKGEMVVDFISFLPFILRKLHYGSFPGFTFLRLLRVLRLQRYLRDVPSFQLLVGPYGGRVKLYQLQITRIGSTIFTTLFITSGLVYSVEAPYNPQLSNYFSAFYFSLTSLTTVGFGDITPVTPAGKAVVSGAILVGIGLIPYQLSNAVEAFIDSRRRAVSCPRCSWREHMRGANFCARCGKELPMTSETQAETAGWASFEESSDDFFS